MNEEEKQDLENELLEIPNKIMELQRKLYAINNKIEEIQREKRNIELNTYNNVSEEKTEEGKKKYTNDTQRQKAMNDELANNQGYNEILNELNKRQNEYNETYTEIGYWKNRLRAMETVVQL